MFGTFEPTKVYIVVVMGSKPSEFEKKEIVGT
jgi:hypothetical protein